MTEISRTAYPCFKSEPNPKELAEFYTPTEAEMDFARSQTANKAGRFCLLVLLKAFQRLGYFPDLRLFPPVATLASAETTEVAQTVDRICQDGSKFQIHEHSLMSEYHIRYGGYGGIAYHHVSDTYIALFMQFITCGVWEAVYILDGLLKNSSDLQPDTLHADTQGQSATVFGLAYLLGIKLMPRIRNWSDYTFLRPSATTVYDYIDPLFKEVADWKLIETHWQDLIRVALSIKAGKLMPSTVLRRLGSNSRKNRLYQAFQALGKVIRTLFLLEYISDRALRQEITACTNIVEGYHNFLDWVFFAKQGVITDQDPEEQEKRLKYLDLVASAVILHNTVDISKVVRELVEEGYKVDRDLLATLSPYLTRNLKRYGDYVVDMTAIPEPFDLAVNLPIEISES